MGQLVLREPRPQRRDDRDDQIKCGKHIPFKEEGMRRVFTCKSKKSGAELLVAAEIPDPMDSSMFNLAISYTYKDR